MKTLFLSLITVLTLSMASVTSYASADGGTAPDMAPATIQPPCLALPGITPADAGKYMTMVVAQTRFLEGMGFGKAFDQKVPGDVQEVGGQALGQVRLYAVGEAECIALTKLQLGALMTCVDTEIDIINMAKMTKAYFTWVIDSLGAANTADYAAAMSKVNKAFIKALKKK